MRRWCNVSLPLSHSHIHEKLVSFIGKVYNSICMYIQFAIFPPSDCVRDTGNKQNRKFFVFFWLTHFTFFFCKHEQASRKEIIIRRKEKVGKNVKRWCDAMWCTAQVFLLVLSRKYYPFKAIRRNMKMKWKYISSCEYVESVCPTTCETPPSRKVDDDDGMLFIIIRRNSNDKVRYFFSRKKGIKKLVHVSIQSIFLHEEVK